MTVEEILEKTEIGEKELAFITKNMHLFPTEFLVNLGLISGEVSEAPVQEVEEKPKKKASK